MDYAAAFAAGLSASYAVGLGMGVAPALFEAGEDRFRDFSRHNWNREARSFMDYLDANWSYTLIRPKMSNRNFVQVQPEATRTRVVLYTSIWERKMRGVAKFGLAPSIEDEKPQSCISGGAVAAVVDQIMGVFAISMMFFPVVTANLDVQFKEPIPLGTELAFVCKCEEGSDNIKKLVTTLTFYSLRPREKDKKTVHIVATAVFVNSMLPNFIRSMI